MQLLTVLLLLLVSLPVEIVRLSDGTLVHGEIVEFDEATGVTVERADTGGRLRLRWEHLPADEVRRIKAARGFTGEEIEPFLVGVVHLVMRNGTTETGILVEDGKRDVYTLRRRHGTDSFPRQYVRSVESGRVEGLAVYAPEELYQVVLDEHGVPAAAADHLAVAVSCEGAGLYENAREHYAAVQQLDPELKRELIATRLERVDIKIEDREETAFLDGIRNRLFKKQFDEAMALVEQFREEYPASRQLGDLAILEGDIGRGRREHYGRKIVSDYFSFLGKSLGEIGRNDDMTLGAALELLDGSVHEEVVDRLVTAYNMTPAGIGQMWEERRGGSVRTSSYGSGTFILGKAKALNWVGSEDDEAAEGQEEPDDEEAEEDLQKRIEDVLKKRAQEAKKRRSQASSGKELSEGITPDEWWERASTDDRIRWMTAYYAESSGHINVLRAKPRNCRTCEAIGFIEVMNDKGEVEAQTCPTCKSLKYERLVNYR
jgi:tetratricopeptide (TPR) repeat protein